jgi:aspartate-semialdehyde dehydrogenase
MRSTGFRIAVINPLTLVGQEIQTILNERGIPYARIELIDTTGKSAGSLTELNDEAAFVNEVSEQSFVGLDLAFFCGPAEVNERWIEQAESDGVLTVDLSERKTLDGEAVPIIAGVNEDRLADGVAAVAATPVAVPVVLLLQQLLRASTLDLCAVSVILPASDKGKEGMDELYQQTVSALNMKSMPKEVFDRQLAFNLYPAPDADAFEAATVEQIQQIVGKRLPLALSVTQGTTFHGHSFSIFVQFSEEMSEETLRQELSRGASIEVAENDESFATIDAAGRDQILIGRIKRDPNVPRAYWLWVVADNLRRSAALNAVMIAETMLARFGEQAN